MMEAVVQDNSYVSEYVKDIPWEKNPAFAFSHDSKDYLNAFKNVVDSLPVGDQKISFFDDKWDFNPYFYHHNTASYVINFEKCPERLKDPLKFYALFSILGDKKISTVNVRVTQIISLLRKIIDKNHSTLFSVSTNDIKTAVENLQGGDSHKCDVYQAIYQFYLFLERNYHISFPATSKELHAEFFAKRAVCSPEDNKLPNIPDEYFYKIRAMAYMVMHDDTTYNLKERITAAVLMLVIETGLRIGEILSLPDNALKERKMSKTGHLINFIHYSSEKPSKAHQEVLEFDIFCTQYCKEAFEILLKLRQETGFADKSDILILYPPVSSSNNVFPIRNDRFNNAYTKLMYKCLKDDCTHDYGESIKGKQYEVHRNYRIQVYIPQTEQFRVHLCSYLYNERHVSLTWIERYMGHLSEAMAGYYVRPKDNYQEDLKEFGKVIQELHDKHLTPLGGDGSGKEIAASINKFIDDNHFNVSSDIQSIADAVEDRVIIRAKTGGVCIKTSLMPCSRDARSDEIMCAYSLCPNLFHFYYMIDISYENFKTMQKTCAVNNQRGHRKEAQKELNKIKALIRRRLIPELDELDKELSSKGRDGIIADYPSLVNIIDNEEIIKEEIRIWQKKEL